MTIPRKDITGTFTENGAAPKDMVFLHGSLKVGAKQYQEFGRNTFGLETVNSIPSSRQNGTYELRIKYKGKTVVFFYDGENMTSRLE